MIVTILRVVAGGILIQLCLGALYAWSAFTARLADAPYGLSAMQSQWVFSLALVSFAVVMALVAGHWQARSGPRLVALVGGLVMGLGYVVGGLAGTNFWGILAGVGLIGGAGIGLAYVIVGPQLGGLMKDLGAASGDVPTWLWAFLPAGVACLVGAAIMWGLRPPQRELQPLAVADPGRLVPAER